MFRINYWEDMSPVFAWFAVCPAPTWVVCIHITGYSPALGVLELIKKIDRSQGITVVDIEYSNRWPCVRKNFNGDDIGVSESPIIFPSDPSCNPDE
jgi:hypothetical protein